MAEGVQGSVEPLSPDEDLRRRTEAAARRRAERDSGAGLRERLVLEGYGRGLTGADKENEISFVIALKQRRLEWLKGVNDEESANLAVRVSQLQQDIQKRYEKFCKERNIEENDFSRFRGVRALIGSSLEPHRKDFPQNDIAVDFYDSFDPPAPFTIAELAQEIEEEVKKYKQAGTVDTGREEVTH